MGGLSLLLPVLLAVAPSQAPAPALVQARLPGGGTAVLRLQFKKGLSLKGARLPLAFLATDADAHGWVPFDQLSPEGKRWALEAFFPRDRWQRQGVRHLVQYPELESVWTLSALFTGHGQNYDKLMAENPGLPEKLRQGDAWWIPRPLLSVDLGGQSREPDRSQPEDSLDDEARVAAYRAMLTYGEDAQGKYAAYHMRKGEALYSAVVMRYTDRVDAKAVNDLAEVIARRSGITDLHGIQPGQLVKIPVEYLADPFQPEGTAALAEEREVRAEVRRTARVEAGPRLDGVRIVLDAGHGGVDIGAQANGIWESDFVYDITMRVRRLLEEETDAQVSSTIRYPEIGFRTRRIIRTPSHDAEILTDPPFSNDGERPNAVSVHLRWVLANELFERFIQHRGDPRKTLFISFHADSLHPSSRGTMVYVPGATLVPSHFAIAANRAGNVAEMRRFSRVSFTPRQKLRGEARSRQFSEVLLWSLQKAGIPVHVNRPIRNVVIRNGAKWVPAVIRYSIGATKVLVEVANLTNIADASNLKDPAFRERYARAVVRAILDYYR